MKDSSGLGPRTRMTHAYGELSEARSFVERRWETSNEKTRVALLKFAKALGALPVKPTGAEEKLDKTTFCCINPAQSRKTLD